MRRNFHISKRDRWFLVFVFHLLLLVSVFAQTKVPAQAQQGEGTNDNNQASLLKEEPAKDNTEQELKQKINQLLLDALNTKDPVRQKEIYTEILKLDPSNQAAY